MRLLAAPACLATIFAFLVGCVTNRAASDSAYVHRTTADTEDFGVSLSFSVGVRSYGEWTYAVVPTGSDYQVVGLFITGYPHFVEPPQVWPISSASVDSLRRELKAWGFYDLPERIEAEGYATDCGGTQFTAIDGDEANAVHLPCVTTPPPVLERIIERFRAVGAPLSAYATPPE